MYILLNIPFLKNTCLISISGYKSEVTVLQPCWPSYIAWSYKHASALGLLYLMFPLPCLSHMLLDLFALSLVLVLCSRVSSDTFDLSWSPYVKITYIVDISYLNSLLLWVFFFNTTPFLLVSYCCYITLPQT